MKAVLLAGGLGTRMREETEDRPKPMVEVGGKPVLWHIMKILSSHGINDFVICAGYKSEMIANYFANYSIMNSDFTVRLGDRSFDTHRSTHDEDDWTITVVNTGLNTMTGGRIKRIRKYIDNEPFFCTYGDGIADVDITKLIEFHKSHGQMGTMTVAKPYSRFGVVEFDKDGTVKEFREKPQSEDWANIGFFIFEPKFFDKIDGDKTILEQEPLRKLVAERQLNAFEHEGFWQPMDTQREYQLLNEIWDSEAPWKRWE